MRLRDKGHLDYYPTPRPPLNWWHGRRLDCPYCKASAELESEDIPVELYTDCTLMHGDIAWATFACPQCEGDIKICYRATRPKTEGVP